MHPSQRTRAPAPNGKRTPTANARSALTTITASYHTRATAAAERGRSSAVSTPCATDATQRSAGDHTTDAHYAEPTAGTNSHKPYIGGDDEGSRLIVLDLDGGILQTLRLPEAKNLVSLSRMGNDLLVADGPGLSVFVLRILGVNA